MSGVPHPEDFVGLDAGLTLGRPPKDPADRRKQRGVRFGDREWSAVVKASGDEGPGPFVRRIVLESVR